MLKKEINPMKMKKYGGNPKRELDKNQYFKDFKSQWDNEMHYVVDEYKSNIFPQTTIAHQVAAYTLNKTMQNMKKTNGTNMGGSNENHSSHSVDSVPESEREELSLPAKLEIVGTKKDPISKKFMVFVDRYARRTQQSSPKV